ncbi:chemotaxis protein [Herbaspirillum sp. meg3]|uniref:methyl-accepting chemotaxis protein n=1 Tax=Herbaspirillum sp. meg3 TaxID=2025949 RepID=UPI000B993B8A|nr:methyl-accepting chemotaxis protein [Herbaspirillum sp. meg3]ASU39508.1 chemotaxis protein [Herbaspirillum sp. meg3]
MKTSNLKIGVRLYLGFGALASLLVIIIAVAYLNFFRLKEANDWNEHTHKVVAAVDGSLLSLINMETGQRGFALTGKDASLEPLAAGQQSFNKEMARAKELTSDNPQQQERISKLLDLQRQWMDTAVTPSITMRRENSESSIAKVIGFEQAAKGKTLMDSMRQIFSDMKGAETSLMSERSQAVSSLTLITTATLLTGGVIGVLAAMILAYWLKHNITRPLAAAVRIAQTVAAGDLTSSIPPSGKDETGQLLLALKDMNDNLLKIVGEVRQSTETIATASGQIAQGNLDLSSRTEQQASSLAETAASTRALTSTVKSNAENSEEASRLANSASEIAIRGGAVVAQVIETMDSINTSARKIVDIISVIDGIAFQTNILALNAAVEAARAGEQGRGFAVVASEVRSLAQRSATAAKEIKGLIDDSVEKVASGSKLVEQAGATMNEVVESVRSVTGIVSEISAASREQSSGIEQVNNTIGQMDEVTQQNAALVEEAAAAAKSLEDQAQNLSRVVSVFKLTEQTRLAAPIHKSLLRHKPSTAASTTVKHLPARPQPAQLTHRPQTPATSDGNDWETF